jgi:AraC-like DNA-binding protein
MRSPELAAFSKPIFSSEMVCVGIFRCPASHPQFADTGPIVSGHLLVFPRTSVCITHLQGEPIVATPNVVMFYNQYQCYRRQPLSAEGDFCDWFAFAPELLISALRPYDEAVDADVERPFRFTHSPSDGPVYLRQRMVVDHILHTPKPDQLFVEESLLGVLDGVVRRAYQRCADGWWVNRWQNERCAAVARTVQELLTAQYRSEVKLADLARTVHHSPYQLCRIFRQQSGYTIHQYLNQLRLRTALEEIVQGADDLTNLALDLGYTSHSHFTQAFRQTFGLPPSRLRRRQM